MYRWWRPLISLSLLFSGGEAAGGGRGGGDLSPLWWAGLSGGGLLCIPALIHLIGLPQRLQLAE